MIAKKKRKVHEEPAQKKKVKSSRSQTIIKIEKDVQIVIKTEDDDQLQTKTKVKKKEKFKEGEYLDQLKEKRKKKKKNKKKRSDSELQRETHSKSFMDLEGHLDAEPQEDSEEQMKILQKKKKKARCRSPSSLENDQSSDVQLSDRHADGTRGESSKKAAFTLHGEATKKKKKKDVFSFPLEGIEDSEQKRPENVCTKTHKCIAQGKAFMEHSCATAMIQNDGESYERRKKRKKNKDRSDFVSPLADNQESICKVPPGTIKFSDFRERQRTLANREEEDTAENSRSSREGRRKKKRSKDVSSLTYEDDPEYSHRGAGKHPPAWHKVESEEKEHSGKKSRKSIKDNQVIKKKKKMQKEEEETTYSEVYLSNVGASKSQKVTVLESSKKNKESETKQAQRVTGDTVAGVLGNRNHLPCDRRSRKRRKAALQDCAEEPGSNASIKKIKKEAMGNEALGHMDDVTIVQEKKGNCDEVNIDKVRRQALQEEIDRESGKTKTKVFSPKVQQHWSQIEDFQANTEALLNSSYLSRQPEHEEEPILGQWSTATFESSEKEMKFFRLMGGFKKGSSVPMQALSATANKANMALNKEGQEKLQQTLKMEFDKAMNLKQHRGVGLGFQPAANKKVYIDKYTTRSIKFED